VFFVSEVEFTKDDKSDFLLDKVKQALEYIFKQHGPKALLPVRSLLLRMLESSLGFNEIHIYFIKICIALELPREALPIIDYSGLFKTLSRSKVAEFLFYSTEIYIKLIDYRKAH
jgi:hypothetical protein